MNDDYRTAAIEWLSTRGYGRALVNDEMTDSEIADLLWQELVEIGATVRE